MAACVRAWGVVRAMLPMHLRLSRVTADPPSFNDELSQYYLITNNTLALSVCF